MVLGRRNSGCHRPTPRPIHGRLQRRSRHAPSGSDHRRRKAPKARSRSPRPCTRSSYRREFPRGQVAVGAFVIGDESGKRTDGDRISAFSPEYRRPRTGPIADIPAANSRQYVILLDQLGSLNVLRAPISSIKLGIFTPTGQPATQAGGGSVNIAALPTGPGLR